MKVLLILALVIASVGACGKRELINPRNIPEKISKKLGITKGYSAFEGQFPYEVALKFSSTWWCAGGIISNQWVLTAAHCTDGYSSVIIHYGSTVRKSPKFAITVGQEHFKPHPDFHKMISRANDIALINTPPVTFNIFINKIALPPIGNRYPTYVGEKTTVAGWGKMSDTGPVRVDKLQYANFDIITNEVCQRGYKSKIDSSTICVATSNKRSPCNGDSGAPMVLARPKQMIGIMSYGSTAGCEVGYPVVFTRITSYLNWIKDVTGVYY